jgi:hypothetical protein
LALYRFLFAPALLAIVVLVGSGPSEPPGATREPLRAAAAPAAPPAATVPVAFHRGASPRPVRAR